MPTVSGLEAPLAPTQEPRAGACEQAAEEGLLAQPPELAFGVESDDGGSSTGAAEAPLARSLSRWRRPRVVAAGAVGAALLLSCLAAGAGLSRRASAPEASHFDDTVELGALDSMLSVMGTFADGVHEAAELSDNVEQSYGAVKDMADSFNESSEKFMGIGGKFVHALRAGPERRKKLLAKFRSLNATQKEKVKQRLFKRFNVTSLKQLRPKAHLTDGNLCHDDEEEHAGLCYKKCSYLTGGSFPYRVSAWECCQHTGACTEHYKVDMGLCSGFSVSGDQVGGGCPHTPGGCLKTEELYGNYCYKRCSLLTLGVLSDRGGPSTCCEKGHGTSLLAFMDADVCDTQMSYCAGGGKGDGDSETPSKPHVPMVRLTERSS